MDPNFFVLRHDHDCINFRLNLVKGHHKCRCISQEWQPKKEKKALINPGFKWVGRCIMEGRGGGGGAGELHMLCQGGWGQSPYREVGFKNVL